MVDSQDPIIRVESLSKRYRRRLGLFRWEEFKAVHGVNLSIARGETVVLVGESGSGKSTFGRMLVRLERPTSGSVWLEGTDIAGLRGSALRRYRRSASIVFQNPYRSLNPRMRVGHALAEPLRVWEVVEAQHIPAEVARLLESVGLPASYVGRYPHELSGGERQRVAIARALAARPEFMVADEAVSALDVSAAAEILNLMLALKRRANLTCLFVTHDLSVARVLADRIAVMRRGEIVELAPRDQLFARPQHEYTRQLLDSQLTLDADREAGAGRSVSLMRNVSLG